ncbi:MAG: hypothetical protein LBR34_12315 [Prevotella sp.]|nr:hypothetical protein [Prevotella sp.]
MKRNLFIVALCAISLGLTAQSVSTQKPKGKPATAARAVVKAPDLKAKQVELKTVNRKAVTEQVKSVLSSKKLNNGMEYRIVKMDNGRIKKQLLRPSKSSALANKITPNTHDRALALTADDDGSINESFEGWDGETPDWLPQGWTDYNMNGSPSNVIDAYGDIVNYTWRVSEGTMFTPVFDGNYAARCQFEMPYYIGTEDEPVEVVPPTTDEWLISPAVEVKADYQWSFYLYYDPLFARFNGFVETGEVDEDGWPVYEYKLDGEHTTVKALITDDNGTTWTELWNSQNYMNSYTDDELWEMYYGNGFPWLLLKFDLTNYLGKTVKVAIQYLDDDGESVMVDRFTLGFPQPDAFYSLPAGFLISGFSPDYYALNSDVTIGQAYTPVQWNSSSLDAESVVWDFGEGQTYNTAGDTYGDDYRIREETNPQVSLPFFYSLPPVLTATGKGGKTASYQWGETNPSLFSGGTISDYAGKVFGAGNYDLRHRFAIYSDVNAEGMADYGTFKGVANYFEKPAAAYMVDTIYVHAGNVVPKTGEPVKLNVYKVNEDGTMGNILATSEVEPEDIQAAFSNNGLDYYTIPFTFKALDPETGFETDTWLEINSAILVEFYNYESADIFFQYENHPDGSSYAYVSLEEGDWLDLGGTSALFDMNVYFPFFVAENDKYDAPATGGTNNFDITWYWEPNYWWMEETLPDWVKIDGVSVNQQTLVATMPITVDPLPEGVTGRAYNITIKSFACKLTLQIKQGDADYLSINQVVSKGIAPTAARLGDDFKLSYPAGVSAVSVYSISGQLVAAYPLPANGSFILPAARLAKGVYTLKFNGVNQAVKVVK